MNCVGSWASVCGACRFNRGPVARLPMKDAKETESVFVSGLTLSGLYTWLRSMSLRRAVSRSSCLSEKDFGVTSAEVSLTGVDIPKYSLLPAI